MLSAWTDGALELSEGTVYNFLAEWDGKAADFVATTKTKLLNNGVLYVDETGARVNARNMFFRNYSDELRVLYTAKRSKELALRFGVEKFEQADLNEYRSRYDKIVESGVKVLKNTKSRFYQKEEKRLLNRLKKYRDNHLLFANSFVVPFDNNLSERDLRMVKTKQKVSGCFRSLAGAKIFANLMSVIKTAGKQNISPFIAVRSVFIGNCCLV